MLGAVYLDEGTEAARRKAVEHFEKWRSISECLGMHAAVADAEQSIALARSSYDNNEGDHWAETSRIRDLYELTVKTHGEDSLSALKQGGIYALSLHNNNRSIEAKRLVTTNCRHKPPSSWP